MEKKSYLIIIISLIVLGLIYFNFSSFAEKAEVNLVKSGEFESLINEEGVFLLQTHTPYIGEIEGTDLITENWKDMASYANELPEDKNTKILVYCRSGGMSGNTSQQLIDLGYKNVYDLSGGMREWEASGRAIINMENEK